MTITDLARTLSANRHSIAREVAALELQRVVKRVGTVETDGHRRPAVVYTLAVRP